MTQYSDEQLEAADVRTRAYMRDINRLDDESKAYAQTLMEVAAEIDMLAGLSTTLAPFNAKAVAQRAMAKIRAQLADREARIAALEAAIDKALDGALVSSRNPHEVLQKLCADLLEARHD